MVLEKGKVAQYGTPIELLKQEGILSTLVKGNGKEYERRMIYLAENKDLILEEGAEIEEEENDDKIKSHVNEDPPQNDVPQDDDNVFSSLLSIGDFPMDDGRAIPATLTGKK